MTDISQVSSLGKPVIAEVERAVVGKRDLLEMMMASVLAGGHILLEDFPGLGKTLVARSFAKVLGLEFKRIQFTPDLLPGDITGGYIFNRTNNKFELRKGPIFANIVLADEINRASPKTQSALLEAMQEGRVTVAGESYELPRPFFVLATQNPIELEGTYPLPEAQLDRFFYKINVPSPVEDDLVEIARRTTSANLPEVHVVADAAGLLQMQELVREVPVEERVYRYAARIVGATHPDNAAALGIIRRSLRVGVSPRGIQALIMASKVEALLAGRKAVSMDDIKKVAYPALRHRLFLSYEAQAEGISPDTILDDVLKSVQPPSA